MSIPDLLTSDLLSPAKPPQDTSAIWDEVEHIAYAIKLTESGGKYKAVAKDLGAGAYQFMPDTWRDWSKEYAGEVLPMTPENQDAVAKWRIATWIDDGLRPDQIALKWNSGGLKHKKGVNQWGVPYDTRDHVQRFMNFYNQTGSSDNLLTPYDPNTNVTTAPIDPKEYGEYWGKRLVNTVLSTAPDTPEPDLFEGPQPEDLSSDLLQPYTPPPPPKEPEFEGPQPLDLSSDLLTPITPSLGQKVLNVIDDAILTPVKEAFTPGLHQSQVATSLDQESQLPVNTAVMGEPDLLVERPPTPELIPYVETEGSAAVTESLKEQAATSQVMRPAIEAAAAEQERLLTERDTAQDLLNPAPYEVSTLTGQTQRGIPSQEEQAAFERQQILRAQALAYEKELDQTREFSLVQGGPDEYVPPTYISQTSGPALFSDPGLVPVYAEPDQREQLLTLTPAEEDKYSERETNYTGAAAVAGKELISGLVQAPIRAAGLTYAGRGVFERVADKAEQYFDTELKNNEKAQSFIKDLRRGEASFFEEAVANLGPTAASGLIAGVGIGVGFPVAARVFAGLYNYTMNSQETRKAVEQSFIDQGLSTEEAQRRAAPYAAIAGSVKALLDQIGLESLLGTSKPAQHFAQWLGRYVANIGWENSTEGVQGVIDAIAEAYSRKSPRITNRQFISDLWNKRDVLSDIFWENVRASFGTSLIAGGVGGAVNLAHAVSRITGLTNRIEAHRNTLIAEGQKFNPTREDLLKQMGLTDEDIASVPQAAPEEYSRAPIPKVKQGEPVLAPELLAKDAQTPVEELRSRMLLDKAADAITPDDEIGHYTKFGDLTASVQTRDAEAYNAILRDVYETNGITLVQDLMHPLKVSGSFVKQLLSMGAKYAEIKPVMKDINDWATPLYYDALEPYYATKIQDGGTLSDAERAYYAGKPWAQEFGSRLAPEDLPPLPGFEKRIPLSSKPSAAIAVLSPFADDAQVQWATELQQNPDDDQILDQGLTFGYNSEELAVIRHRLRAGEGQRISDEDFLRQFQAVANTFATGEDRDTVLTHLMRLKEEGISRGFTEDQLDTTITKAEEDYEDTLHSILGDDFYMTYHAALQSVLQGQGKKNDLPIILEAYRDLYGEYPTAIEIKGGYKGNELGYAGVFKGQSWLAGERPNVELYTKIRYIDEATGKVKTHNVFQKSQTEYQRTGAHEMGHLWHSIEPALIELVKNNPQIAQELWAHTVAWHPFTPDPYSVNGVNYIAYRKSPHELVADGISALVTDPDFLKQTAPTAFDAMETLIQASDATNYEALSRLTAMLPNVAIPQPDPNAKPLHEVYANIRHYQANREALSQQIFNRIVEDSDKGDQVTKEKLTNPEEKKPWEKTTRKLKGEFVDYNSILLDALLEKENLTPTQQHNIDELRLRLNEHPYVRGRLMLYAYDVRAAFRELSRSGADLNLARALVLSRRVAFDKSRAKMPSPYFGNPAYAKEFLTMLEKEVGPEKAAALDKFAKDYFKAWRNNILELAEKVGLFGPRTMKQLKNNDTYVAFQLLEAELPKEIINRQIGTFEKLSDPFVATFHKAAQIVFAAQRTATAQNVRSVLKDVAPDALYTGEVVYNQQTGRTSEKFSPPKGYETVSFMEGGKSTRYAVPEELQQWQSRSPAQHWAFFKLITDAFGFMKQLMVSRNIRWMMGNVPRDFTGTLKKLPGFHFASLAASYVEAQKELADFMYGEKSKSWVPGTASRNKADSIMSTDIRRMLKGDMMLTQRAYSHDIESESDSAYIYQLIRDYGIDFGPEENQNAKQRFAKGLKSYLSGRKLWDWLGEKGEMSEKISKLAGFKTILKSASITSTITGLSKAQIKTDPLTQRVIFESLPEYAQRLVANFVRDNIGTPNPMKRGSMFNIINNLVWYFNINVQDLRSSIEVAKARPLEYAIKTLGMSIAPRAIMFLIAQGIIRFPGDSEDDVRKRKALYDGVSDYVKANYIWYPTGFKLSDNRHLIFVAPESYADQTMGSIFQQLLNYSWEKAKKDPSASVGDLTGLISTVLTAVPWLQGNLAMDIGHTIREWVTGFNPVDDWSGLPVVDTLTFKAGGWPAQEAFLQYMGSKLTNGMVPWRADTEKNISEAERFLNHWAIRPLVGKFFRITGGGHAQRLEERFEERRTDMAEQSVKIRDRINEHIIDQAKLNPKFNPHQTWSSLWREMKQSKSIAPDITMAQFRERYLRQSRVYANELELNLFVRAGTSKERADARIYIEKEFPREEAQKIIDQARKEGFINEDVFREYKRLKGIKE